MKEYGIHWFRRDLRVAANPALRWNQKRHQGNVLGIFCFDHSFLSREDFSHNRFQFFLNSLKELRSELRQLGSDLLVMDIGPQRSFVRLFSEFRRNDLALPQTLTWCRDYEPFARDRDKEIKELIESHGVSTRTFRDHLVIEPNELTKPDNVSEGYQVYSPFARRWLEIFSTPEMYKRISSQTAGFRYLGDLKTGKVQKVFHARWSTLLDGKMHIEDHLDRFISENSSHVTVPIPQAGSLKAFEALDSFIPRLKNYKDERDFPQRKSTSHLSPFLKNGSLTLAQIISHLGLTPYKKKTSGQDTYFSELIWREFYYHILYRHPNVEKEAFHPQYRDIEWPNNTDWFEAWKMGKTGFPIVDAGMRQLKTTGQMHNRVRMIVASFLCKDLLIDWRWGEKHFMKELLDGDLAANNGGWQWAASTGCDPQPYFRIFNPWLQSAKFDKQGEYIKRFIPELRHLSAKDLHQPILDVKDYPQPIVDHKVQREKALAIYYKARDKS